MSEFPSVSIIMPAYNVEAFIEATIDAVLKQTLIDFELIVIDDGSTDRTADLVESFARRDPRIVLLRNETNLGLIEAPNRGLAIAKGEYVARMDSDDLCPRHKFARQVAYLEAHPEVVAVTSWGKKFGTATGTVKGPVSPEDIKLRLIFDNSLTGGSMVARRSWLEDKQIRYRTESVYAEDYDIWVQISEAGGTIANLREILLLYRIHNQSISESRYAQQQKAAMEVRYRQWANRGCVLSVEERAFLEGPLNHGHRLSKTELETCRSILAKFESMRLPTKGWKVSFELGRFFSAVLAGNFNATTFITASGVPRPRSRLTDKIKLAWSLWRISPKLALSYLPLYLFRRL